MEIPTPESKGLGKPVGGILGALCLAGLIVITLVSCSAPDGQQEWSDKPYTEYVSTPTGKVVLCVFSSSVNSAGVSCNWEEFNNKEDEDG